MSYMHIDNLYKDKQILMFKRCFAMEKIHGTSAHLSYKNKELKFFSGGCSAEAFVALFDKEALQSILDGKSRTEEVTVYGEAYGGKLQGMSETYGKELRFVAFEVKIGNTWLAVPQAEGFARSLGLDFVPWMEITTDLKDIDQVRDLPSEQARKLGRGEHIREGVVLRPPVEVTLNNGERIIAKHKRDEFRETKSPRVVGQDLSTLTKSKEVADEWVTEERLNHILTGNNIELDITKTGEVIRLMDEDIRREAGTEIVFYKGTDKEIAKATAIMFKKRLTSWMQAK
jgi:hypothetical protein